MFRAKLLGFGVIGVFAGFSSHIPWAQAEERDVPDTPSVAIVSPVQGFATKAPNLQVTVRFRVDADTHRSVDEKRVARLRLWLDGSLVGSFENSPKVRQGTHTFNVDVSTHPDAVVQLQAALVLEKSQKDSQVRSPKVRVVLDKTPPTVTIVSPLGNSIVATRSVEVRGLATDNLSGLGSVSVNGTPASPVKGVFFGTLTLPFSLNPITIVAADRAGNVTTIQRSVIQSSLPPVGPVLLSIPPTAALVGKTLQHQVVAASADPASIVFSLSKAPTGMSLDRVTGLIVWTPAPNQATDQLVTIVAADSKGKASQSFTLSVFGSRAVASALISAATGGVITVNDPASTIYGLSISIPAGALLANTTIHISELLSPPTLGGTPRFLLKGFSVEPDGTLLAALATVTLPYSTSEFNSREGIPLERFLGTYFLDTSTGSVKGLASFSVDPANHVVTGSVSHFSAYYVTNYARLCPPPTAESDCPSTAPAPSPKIPAIFVNGFQIPFGSGMGDESTWGQLRYLLNRLDLQGSGHIDAFRFDWDSAYTHFELSAGGLAAAIVKVKEDTAQGFVNLVAHSFGGILVRTYLQNQADFGRTKFQFDVNRVMTLGTPHQGIGGIFSTISANICATASQTIQPLTCFEVNTGDPRIDGEGNFLRHLNGLDVPPFLSSAPLLPKLQSDVSPQYYIIRGQLLSKQLVTELVPDDGLITLAGSEPCPVGHPQLCKSDVLTEIIASSETDAVGLCHTGELFKLYLPGCSQPIASNGQSNVAMVEVNNKAHPLWQKMCEFLGADSSICRPQLIVSLSDRLAGTVTSDASHPGIRCGSNCSMPFDSDSIVLVVAENAGYRFTGWSGACLGTSLRTTIVRRGDDDQTCVANFIRSTPNPNVTISGTFRGTVSLQYTIDYGRFTFPLGPGVQCTNNQPVIETDSASVPIELIFTPSTGPRGNFVARYTTEPYDINAQSSPPFECDGRILVGGRTGLIGGAGGREGNLNGTVSVVEARVIPVFNSVVDDQGGVISPLGNFYNAFNPVSDRDSDRLLYGGAWELVTNGNAQQLIGSIEIRDSPTPTFEFDVCQGQGSQQFGCTLNGTLHFVLTKQ